jgi:hypothetical protein
MQVTKLPKQPKSTMTNDWSLAACSVLKNPSQTNPEYDPCLID